MSTTSTPAGWHPDPTGRHQHRYWDGQEWTEHVADAGVSATDPPTMDSAAAPTAVASPAASPTASPTASPSAPGAWTSPTPSRADRANPVFAFTSALGGLALVVGSFLDAATASAAFGDTSVESSKSYLDGDGPITLVIGLAIIALAVLVGTGVIPRWGALIVGGLGVVGAIVAVIDILDVQDQSDKLQPFGGSIDIGPALWVCLVGGVAAVVLSLLAFTMKPGRTAPTV